MVKTIQGKDTFLSFKIGDEIFAFEISNVIEVLEQQLVTYVPKTKQYIKGVTNFRGNLLPVIDLGSKIGMKTEKKDNVVIVLEQIEHGKNYYLGAMVDAVVGVQQLQSKDILPLPEMKTEYSREYVCGVFKRQQDYIIILDNKIVLE